MFRAKAGVSSLRDCLPGQIYGPVSLRREAVGRSDELRSSGLTRGDSLLAPGRIF